MIRASEVLEYYFPNGGWAIVGNDYEGIQFLECEPISKKQFEDGFEIVKNIKEKKASQAAAAKAAAEAKLVALGLTSDDLKALGL
jgi:hypothetical protein